MASEQTSSAAQYLHSNSQNGELYLHPDRELFAVAAKRKIDFSGHRMAPLSGGELLLYMNVLNLESDDLIKVNLATLNTLIGAHVENIPFQGIDAFVGHQPTLDDDSVFRKVIEQRRGGYCVELNRLGGGRPQNTPRTPLGHMLFCVDLGEEGEYFADVGFGGPNPFKALPVEGETAPYRTRRLDEEGNVEVAIRSTGRGSASGSWRPIYHVFPPPQKWIDFVPTYWHGSKNPRSLFRKTLMVARFGDDSWLTLVDGCFCRRYIDGQVQQRSITDVDELIRLLDTEFTLKLDPGMDIDSLRTRIKSVI
ncbi:hypothetical protein MTO96_033147 [Rhipicephalus appendiculatus]